MLENDRRRLIGWAVRQRSEISPREIRQAELDYLKSTSALDVFKKAATITGCYWEDTKVVITPVRGEDQEGVGVELRWDYGMSSSDKRITYNRVRAYVHSSEEGLELKARKADQTVSIEPTAEQIGIWLVQAVKNPDMVVVEEKPRPNLLQRIISGLQPPLLMGCYDPFTGDYINSEGELVLALGK